METITVEQFSDLKHAIGYKRDKIKDGKYYAWRNFFGVSNESEQWEDLVNRGFATKNTVFGEIVYHVSDEGFQFLSDILDIEIVTEEPEQEEVKQVVRL